MRFYRTIIKTITLYGCETWTPTAPEKNKLRTFEMAALRTIQNRQRRNSQKSRMHEHPLTANLCQTTQIIWKCTLHRS